MKFRRFDRLKNILHGHGTVRVLLPALSANMCWSLAIT